MLPTPLVELVAIVAGFAWLYILFYDPERE